MNTDTSYYAIRELDAIARSKSNPIILWMGAGVSAWRGYPLWKAFAEQMHSEYIRKEPDYHTHLSVALELLKQEKLPEFFSLCTQINKQRYYSIMSTTFGPRQSTPIYDRFIKTLMEISPVQILTTNIDESLEKSLPFATIQGSDLERANVLIRQKTSFVCKLHGSISALDSIIFTQEDYMELSNNRSFIQLLGSIFLESTIVFCGYGLRDEYVLQSLFRVDDLSRILGNGPHFIIAPNKPSGLPSSVRYINYDTALFSDHRSAIKLLDMLAMACRQSKIEVMTDTRSEPDLKLNDSRYLLGALFAPGTWSTSQTASIMGNSGIERSMLVGTGFVNDELPEGLVERSLHDLIVGLICFDKLYQ